MSGADLRSPRQRVGAGARFRGVVGGVHRCLPARLRALVPASFLAFAVVNAFTFTVDLAVLALLYDGLGVPHPVAITVGYATAFTLAFLLNRWLTFDVHHHLGSQTVRYLPVLAVNYLGIILGIGSGLVALGVPYLPARLVAGVAEAVWMYSAMRWFVFRGRPTE